MSEKVFSNKEALRFGWSVIKSRPVWILIFVIQIAINIAGSALTRVLGGWQGVALQALLFVFGLFLSFNVFAASLKSCDGKDVSVGDLFAVQPRFVPFLLGSLMLTVIVALATFLVILAMTALTAGAAAMGAKVVVAILLLGGFLVFAAGYLLLLVRFSFFPFAILELNEGAVTGFRRSWRLTSGAALRIALFLLLLVLVNLAGVACLFVGLLVTAPLTFLASAHVYRQLAAQATPAA
jgi:hypothetical protein